MDYFRVTSAAATSPTTASDFAEILSIVSWGVWCGDVSVTEVGGRLPDPRDDLGSLLKGDHLVWNAEILVTDHVPENSVERFVTRRWRMSGEIFRADQNVHLRRAERTVVLSVGEEQIDADVRLRFLQEITEGDEQADAGSPVVRARHRHLLLRFGCRRFGDRPRIPVRDVKDALRQLGAEPRQYVAERKLLPVRGRVGEALDNHSVGARAHHADDPVAGLFRRRRSRNARTEIDLRLRIVVGRGAVEAGGRRAGAIRSLRSTSLLCVAVAGRNKTHEQNQQHRSHLNSPA